MLTIVTAISLITLSIISSTPMSSGHAHAHAPWPTFHQNPQHTGLSHFKGPSSPILKWKYQTAGSILSSPAIAFGTVYVGSDDGNLYALDRAGVLKWRFVTGGPIESSPAIGRDGTIYFGSFDGYVYAIDSNGHLKWKFNTGNEVLSSPTIGSNGTIYIGSLNGHFYAIGRDGTLKWMSPQCCDGIYDSAAIASDGTIYLGIDDPGPTGQCAECLQAVNPNGTIRWGSNTGQVEESSPVVSPDGTVYIGSINNGFSAVSPNGTIKWSLTGKPGETIDSTAAIDQSGTVYVVSRQEECLPISAGHNGCSLYSTTRIYGVSTAGKIGWTFSTTGKISASVLCCVGGFGFSSPAIDAKGIVFFGSEDGSLYAVKGGGTMLWKMNLHGAVGSSPAIDQNETIYVGSTDGNLYAIGNSNAHP